MKTIKKLLIFVLALAFVTSAGTQVKAKEIEEENPDFIKAIECVNYIKTTEGIEVYCDGMDLSNYNFSDTQISEINDAGLSLYIRDMEKKSGKSLLRRGRPTHVVESGKKVRKTFSGYAGGQPDGGNRFTTGGGFYYSENGGPTITIGVSFDPPFNYRNVSVNLGMSVGPNANGKYVSVPDTVHYYKLHVSKTYDCTPYTVYEIDSHGNRSVYGGGVSKVLYSISQGAVRVG